MQGICNEYSGVAGGGGYINTTAPSSYGSVGAGGFKLINQDFSNTLILN